MRVSDLSKRSGPTTMFSYFGSKRKIARHYPPPALDTIVEPFAGSAGYSMYGDNWRRQVILYDLDPRIVTVWKWLQKATPRDILILPDLKVGDKVPQSLSDAERWLLGYCCQAGIPAPARTTSSHCAWQYRKQLIAKDLHKIRHWRIYCAPFGAAKNVEATWFIDPPYEAQGHAYTAQPGCSYTALGEWCRSRLGQVIVCEAIGAAWLPFAPLFQNASVSKHTREKSTQVEVVWLNEHAGNAAWLQALGV